MGLCRAAFVSVPGYKLGRGTDCRGPRPRDGPIRLPEIANHDILAHYAQHGVADLDEAMREGSGIVEACWPDIEKLATYLQKKRWATFSQVSKLLDLPNGLRIYDER